MAAWHDLLRADDIFLVRIPDSELVESVERIVVKVVFARHGLVQVMEPRLRPNGSQWPYYCLEDPSILLFPPSTNVIV